jgi:hypothetical protein
LEVLVTSHIPDLAEAYAWSLYSMLLSLTSTAAEQSEAFEA